MRTLYSTRRIPIIGLLAALLLVASPAMSQTPGGSGFFAYESGSDDNGTALRSVTTTSGTWATIDTSGQGRTDTPFLNIDLTRSLTTIDFVGGFSYLVGGGLNVIGFSQIAINPLLSLRICIDNCVGSNILISWVVAVSQLNTDKYATTSTFGQFLCDPVRRPACNVGGLHSFLVQWALASNNQGNPGPAFGTAIGHDRSLRITSTPRR